MQTENDMLFQAYDWQVDDESDELSVIAWCLDESSRPCCVRIQGFVYYGYLDVEDRARAKQFVKESLRATHVEEVERRKLYGYAPTPRPMLRVMFRTRAALIAAVKKFRELGWPFYEHSVSPILKLLAFRNIGFASWFRVALPARPPLPISTVDEYVVHYKNVHPVDSARAPRPARPKLFAFDIECYSENPRVVPDPAFARNAVFMISVVVQRCGAPDSRGEWLLTSVPVLLPPESRTRVVRVHSELELLRAWESLLIQEDPDVVMGFNVFGFDFPYLSTRMGLYLESWRPLGRRVGEVPSLKRIAWESAAYGEQKMCILSMSGRLAVDLRQIIARDYKLPQYNLNTVATKFLGRAKKDVSVHEIFRAYERREEGTLSRVGEYCVEDSRIVMDVFERLDTWIGLVEMSNIFWVPIAELFTRGQQVRCFSQLFRETYRAQYVIEAHKEDSESFEGAEVFDPVVGMHENVICFDFKSLYPSIIRAQNICYTTFCEDESVPDSECSVIEWTEQGQRYRYRFCRREEGLLPRIVRELVQQRSAVRRLAAKETDPTMAAVYDKRQWALKISANSFFGFLGTGSKGRLPLLAASRSITAEGRRVIRECQAFLRGLGARIIYGDTDSVFFTLGTPDAKSTFEAGERLLKKVNERFAPLEMEFEKCGRMLCIAKKNYVFWAYDKKSGEFGERIYKGIALARRDKCEWLRRVFERVLESVMQRAQSACEVYEYVQREVMRLYCRSVPASELFMVRGVRAYYEKNNALKIFTERLKQEGYVLPAGARVEYVVVEGAGRVGDRMLLRSEYGPQRGPDRLYYIEKLEKHIDRLMYAAFPPHAQLFAYLQKKFPELELERAVEMMRARGHSDEDIVARLPRIRRCGGRISACVREFQKALRADTPIANLLRLLRIREALMREMQETVLPTD